jgi:hypothetical protein
MHNYTTPDKEFQSTRTVFSPLQGRHSAVPYSFNAGDPGGNGIL